MTLFEDIKQLLYLNQSNTQTNINNINTMVETTLFFRYLF